MLKKFKAQSTKTKAVDGTLILVLIILLGLWILDIIPLGVNNF